MRVSLIKKKDCGVRKQLHLKCTLFIFAIGEQHFLKSRFTNLIPFVTHQRRTGLSHPFLTIYSNVKEFPLFFPFLFFLPFEDNPLSPHLQSTSQIGRARSGKPLLRDT